ncbi:ATP-binding protein [Hydrogenophaga sp.]|uniref:ATP-binding protein n=1 Tax=Hydrogenophaga sp. TaxID=1904254 RepID=UPI00286E9CFB|nr:ATP-binding protein [Hydrogenophaga sp.]
MPLIVTFPLVLAALVVLGGQRVHSILQFNLRSQLGSALNYLDQRRNERGAQLGRLVRTPRVQALLDPGVGPDERQRVLAELAEQNDLDYLLIVLDDGRVLGAASPVDATARLADDPVLRQARIGLTTAAFARLPPSTLATLGQALPDAARVPRASAGDGPDTPIQDGLLIHAAAHFPLGVDTPDAMLVGGSLLNRNTTLIGHMRELIFPIGTLPDDTEGITLLAIEGRTVAISQQRQNGGRTLGMPVPPEAARTLLGGDPQWLGRQTLGDAEYMTGYQRLVDGRGQTIGAVAVAFPYAPYQRTIHLLLWSVGGVLAMTTLLVSASNVATARQLVGRLGHIVGTMAQVRRGARGARVERSGHHDELEHLAQHFNRLLDTIEAQDAAQRSAQKTIADEASRRRALFEHERDGVVIVNHDGSVFEANPAAAVMLGHTPERLLQLSIADWEAQFSLVELRKIIETLGPVGTTFESVLRRGDGSTFPAEVSLSRAEWGGRTFVVALLRDISERKAAQQQWARFQDNLARVVDQRTRELNERTEELNTIFAISPDGVVSFDRRGRVVSANAAFTRLTGLTGLTGPALQGMDEASLSDQLAALCVQPESFPGLAAMRQTLADDDAASIQGHSPRRWQIDLTGPGQHVLEISLRVSESDHVSQVLYLRDITHESEIDRMKSEFLSTAAHELRTPMASIYGFTELMLARPFSEEKRRDLLETIARQATRMSTIIDELLDLARIEARRGKDFVLEAVELQDVIRLVAGDYQPPQGRDAPLIEVGAAPITLHADRSKLQQALLNILSNAYKYSPGGGPVRIACALDPTGRRASVSVSDQGLGMTREQCDRVFERFYRADTSGHIPGTGLGMSIVKEIVDIHGGQVEVRSAPGEGTTVTLVLPVHARPREASAVAQDLAALPA